MLTVLDLLARWPTALSLVLSLQPVDDGIRYFSLKDPEPERGLAWFILNAFFLVGVALVATLAVGIAFGSFRYWLLEKFPNNRFNGVPEDDPAQTLRLNDTRPADDISQ
ncbi:MAG: hypothetical protein ACRD3V_11230 [Vicinamibacteria bacterium]